MGETTLGWAKLALRQQVEIFGGDHVSLDSLWRRSAIRPDTTLAAGLSWLPRCSPASRLISIGLTATSIRPPIRRGSYGYGKTSRKTPGTSAT